MNDDVISIGNRISRRSDLKLVASGLATPMPSAAAYRAIDNYTAVRLRRPPPPLQLSGEYRLKSLDD
jgi:hypothetical protein